MNSFLLQEFARYYLAKKPSQAQGQELETKAELLQPGEWGPCWGGGGPEEARATSAGKHFPSVPN